MDGSTSVLPGVKHMVIGLVSGGKDSCFNLMHCVANGHSLVALATLQPEPGIGQPVHVIELLSVSRIALPTSSSMSQPQDSFRARLPHTELLLLCPYILRLVMPF